MVILALSFAVVARAHRYLQRYAPANVIEAHLRRARPCLAVAAAPVGLAATFAAGAFVIADWVATSGPGWLYLVVIYFFWNAMKFAWLAVLSPLVLLRAVLAGCSSSSVRRAGLADDPA